MKSRFSFFLPIVAIFFASLATMAVGQQRQMNGARVIELTVWEDALKGRTLAASHDILTVMGKVSEARYMSKTVTFTWPAAPGAAPLDEALIETTALDASGNAVGKPGYGRISINSPDYKLMVVPLKEIAAGAKSVKVRILPKDGTAILETSFSLKWEG